MQGVSARRDLLVAQVSAAEGAEEEEEVVVVVAMVVVVVEEEEEEEELLTQRVRGTATRCRVAQGGRRHSLSKASPAGLSRLPASTCAGDLKLILNPRA